MVHILFWIIFGGLVGLVAAVLKGNAQLTSRSYALILIGAVGGVLGGLVGSLINPDIDSYESWEDGLFCAIAGAIFLVFATSFIHQRLADPIGSSSAHNARRQSD